MSPDAWALAVAASLLAAAAVVGVVAQAAGPAGVGRWRLPGLGLAIAAAAALVVALALAVVARQVWSPFDLEQTTIALAAATLVIYLALAIGLRAGGGLLASLVGLVVLALTLFGWLAIRPGGSAPNVVQRGLAVQIQWGCFILGSGGAVVAGCAGLALAIRAGLIGRGHELAWSRRADLHHLLSQAAGLAAVALAAGLAVGTWWAWQATGSPAAGDPRVAWLVAAWLVVLMVVWTYRLGERSGRWAAGLSVVAAALAVTGLLAVTDLRLILGL
jgi:hypothetical protein